MRQILILASTALIGGLAVGYAADSASADPLAGVSGLSEHHALLETVGWRRRYERRHRTDFVPPPVAVMTPNGPALVTPRPSSCGEYHYWNGMACLDARYHDPSLGAKP